MKNIQRLLVLFKKKKDNRIKNNEKIWIRTKALQRIIRHKTMRQKTSTRKKMWGERSLNEIGLVPR